MTVVAAVIERDGLILICQRKAGGKHSLKWEFPGGKVEPGEDPSAALARELTEELGIRARIGEEMDSYPVRYGDGPSIHLLFFRVADFDGEPRNLEFERIAWEQAGQLASYDFLEGDLPFLRRLSAR